MSDVSNKFKKILCGLFCLLFALTLTLTPIYATPKSDTREVILGGCLFGVKMHTKGVTVVSIDSVDTQNGKVSPAYDAGLKPRDSIIKVNERAVTRADEVVNSILNSSGNAINLTVERDGNTRELTLTPIKGSDGKYHAGFWIRDSAAGIGTVTYIDPITNEFAGLGHGICDGDTASLLSLSRGIVTEVQLNDVIMGQCGVPGELKGSFKGGKIGSLVKNTDKGVYGIFSQLPCGVGQKIKVARLEEIREGEATIRCSVSGSIEEYKIVVKKINKCSQGKNFSIKVTDERLLKITGGIVQGMSGSPIIQNGKLIGAVTHVTVNDPTEGYGIYIGNMLNAAQMPMQNAA